MHCYKVLYHFHAEFKLRLNPLTQNHFLNILRFRHGSTKITILLEEIDLKFQKACCLAHHSFPMDPTDRNKVSSYGRRWCS